MSATPIVEPTADRPAAGPNLWDSFGFSVVAAPAAVINRDVIAVFLWYFAATMNPPGATPLRYILAAYFAVGLVLYPSKLLPATLRSWPAFLFPILCVISAIWAPVAGDAIRKGLLLGLSVIIPVYIATRLTARQFIYVYFVVELIAAALSFVFMHREGPFVIGIFNQKNYLAQHMLFLFLAGVVLVSDGKARWWFRCLAVAGIPMALTLIFLSRSATTLGLAAAASCAFMVQGLVWSPARRVLHMRSLLVFIALLLVALIAFIIFGVLNIDPGRQILSLLGKDSTLTGRTYLWAEARSIMDQHPWTGLGAEAFWKPNVGESRQILRYFKIDDYIRFSFHNSYLENGVSCGYPGMYATIIMAAWGLFHAMRNWTIKQDMFNMYFMTFAILIVIRSNTEIDFATEFGSIVAFLVAAIRRNPSPPVLRPAMLPAAGAAAPPVANAEPAP